MLAVGWLQSKVKYTPTKGQRKANKTYFYFILIFVKVYLIIGFTFLLK